MVRSFYTLELKIYRIQYKFGLKVKLNSVSIDPISIERCFDINSRNSSRCTISAPRRYANQECFACAIILNKWSTAIALQSYNRIIRLYNINNSIKCIIIWVLNIYINTFWLIIFLLFQYLTRSYASFFRPRAQHSFFNSIETIKWSTFR